MDSTCYLIVIMALFEASLAVIIEDDEVISAALLRFFHANDLPRGFDFVDPLLRICQVFAAFDGDREGTVRPVDATD